MLSADLRDPAAIARAREAWARSSSLRVEGVLEEGAAREVLDAVRAEPHAITLPDDPTTIAFQYWKWVGRPEPDCDHTLCRLGRVLQGDLLAWVAEVTGLELAPAPDRQVASALYTKGSYLDAHDDWGRGRAVAYVLGLTQGLTLEPWPAEAGGWLEFLASREGPVLERRPPGWNTLDLFDVRAPGRWHRVPILREHRARRVIAGWFHPRG